MPDCKKCENQKWKEHYTLAQQRFDKVLSLLTIGFFVAFTIVVICLFTTICFSIKMYNSIEETKNTTTPTTINVEAE